jgi:hypothetical protein
MFVSVDMQKLVFLHKHHDHDTVSGLAWLEAAERSVLIESTARREFLLKLTDLELRMLYKNTTKSDPPVQTGVDSSVFLRELLATIVDSHMLARLAIREEVEAQCEHVSEDLYKGIPWSYAIGSKRPAKQRELFPLAATPVPAATVAQAAQLAPQRRITRAAAAVAPAPKAAPSAPPAAKVRQSSVRPIIWAVADSMWEAAGKPTDKTVVLELRKKMMSALEADKGVKRTSSSNELGNWMKARLG